MSGKEEPLVPKERRDSKNITNKAHVNLQDRGKFKRENENSNAFVSKVEATSSNYSPHKTNRNHSNSQTNRNIPRKNIAQNRLNKLRTKLVTEIKIKDKIETVGVSRLLNESVVKVEKSRNLPNKQKSPKIQKNDYRSTPYVRNIASERLKKVKKEFQATSAAIESTQSSTSALESAVEGDSFMEIVEDISETDEKLLNQNHMRSNIEKISTHPSQSLLNNDNVPFGYITPKNPPKKFGKESHGDLRYDVVPFVNDEIYKIRNEPSYVALHTNFLLDNNMKVDTPVGDLLIVIDTNVFLSHLDIISSILNSSIPSLSSCVVVVPWPVIQEIDYAMKKNNERLNNQARFANNFINDCLKKKIPRFFAQSLIDFKDNFKNAVNVDDFILQYCMKFVSFNKKVILLTNDRNLCSKAMINNLSVFTTKEFVNSFYFSE